MSQLAGKIAAVTSVGSGVGVTIATSLAKEGADVALLDFELVPSINQAAFDIQKLGCRTIALATDLNVQTEVQNAFEQISTRLGKPEILVNNGPINLQTPVVAGEVTEADWDDVINRNLTVAFLCSQAVLPSMEKVGHGSIINVSLGGAIGWDDFAGPQHVAAKAGITGLTRHLSREFGPKGIRVNAVGMGLTQIREIEAWWSSRAEKRGQEILREISLRRLATPIEHAQVVVFLASDPSSYITGTTIEVSGGMFTI